MNLVAAIQAPSLGPVDLVAVNNTIITATPGYVDYNAISFNFTYIGSFTTFTNYEYSISTDATDEASFEANIVQTVNSSTQLINKLYRNLSPQVVHYVRVKATGPGGAVYSNFSANTALGGQISDPCTEFTVNRVDDGDGTYTLTVTTNLAEEGVYVSEAMNDVDIRGLTRPLANDEFGNLFLAVVEGTGFDANSITTGGRGVFDAGMLKYENDQWNALNLNSSSNVYNPNYPAQYAFLVNAINYTSRQFRQTGKTLYLNDSPGHPDAYRGGTFIGKYDVTHFNTPLDACSTISGRTMDHWKDETANMSHHRWFVHNDANETTQSYVDYLNEYDTLIFVSGKMETTTQVTLPEKFIDAIHEYMDQGGGLIVLTDHGVFQWNVNEIVRKFGMQMTGNVNRDTDANNADGLPAYQVDTILANTQYHPGGFHPLFENLGPGSRLAAGATEGEIQYFDTAAGLLASEDLTPTARTSSYDSGPNKTVTITNHTDAANTDLTGGKLIIRTASGCGAILPAIP